MPLKSFVIMAKKNTPQLQTYNPNKPMANFIDATETSMLAKAQANGTTISWESCKHLKKDGSGKCLCSQFFTNCVQQKCAPKFIRV